MTRESLSQSIQERSLQVRATVAVGIASLAMFGVLHQSEDADAYGRTKSNLEADGDMRSYKLTFNPRTGKTICDVEQRTGQEFLNGPIVLTRIEQWDDKTKEWQSNQFFKQPFEQGPKQEDQLLAKTTLKTTYNSKRLRRADELAPTRIACYGADDKITLPLIYKHPKKAK